MGLIDLFIVDKNKPAEEPAKQTIKETSTNKFPSSEPEQTSNGLFNFGSGSNKPSTPTFEPSNTGGVSEEHLLKAIEIYQNGFDSLNQPGYDFYEFYQAIISGGVGNSQIYPMAFAMANAMDKSVTKDKLIQQSDYYISEINKVYTDYVSKGGQKKQEFIEQKNHENQSLVGELNLMTEQLEALKTQIEDRKNKLAAIGSKYEPKINEIDSKLAANNLAKDKIIQSIEQVKTGILNNLK